MKRGEFIVLLFGIIFSLFLLKANIVFGDTPVCDNSSVNSTYCGSNISVMTCTLSIVSGNETYNWTASNCASGKTCSNGSCVNITTPAGNCTENWLCGSWGNCIDNAKIRTCIDNNNCNTTLDKPETNQSCNVTTPITNCTNECSAIGSKTCFNNTSYKTCANVSGCLKLGNAINCGSGKTCSNGSCVNAVNPNACTTVGNRNGTKYCSSSKVLTSQKLDGAVCSQSYECQVNSCIDGKCEKKSNTGLWIILGVVAIIIIAVIIIIFFILRKKPSNQQQSQPAAVMNYPRPPSMPPMMPQQPIQPRPQFQQPQTYPQPIQPQQPPAQPPQQPQQFNQA